MSTWFSSFSLPNPFSDDDDGFGGGGGEDQDSSNANYGEPFTHRHPRPPNSPNSTSSPTAGVKQDLSALSQSFSQQLRGVAAFLAPPPSTANNSYLADKDASSTTRITASPPPTRDSNETITGIKKDLAEIGGGFKSLFSSSSSGISKFASNLLQFQGDDDAIREEYEEEDDQEEEEDPEEDIPGINEDVVDFVRKASLRPELWTDFPLSLPIDFNLSDVQREHAATIEELVPSILTLRQTCNNLSDGQFWMIYFILLLPRLNETDSELLSTSQIVEVRETLLKKLQNKKDKDAQMESSGSETGNTSTGNEQINAAQDYTSKTADITPEEASSSGKREVQTLYPEESLKHEDAGKNKPLNDLKDTEDLDDVSFSDLEDDDNESSDRASSFKPSQSGRASSASESNEWVRLNETSGSHGSLNKSGLPTRRGKDSEGEDSSDWLTVDDSDTDTLPGAL
ncbi:OLC1v1038086C1 [Oldenlandia corymbosa var. corymbosa]|uniref:OLC1v1038086C1 n=1 Tax=Oldenlandia corymbosa var. corymbosa TaxID=529605 RepID=A0AAV1CZM1_OLDCO|nr:OLC1v1038086C1 [Oldenlandia corymbosa var. corymbosa]